MQLTEYNSDEIFCVLGHFLWSFVAVDDCRQLSRKRLRPGCHLVTLVTLVHAIMRTLAFGQGYFNIGKLAWGVPLFDSNIQQAYFKSSFDF